MFDRMGTSSATVYFENEQQVYPCRCGQVHRGDYALYEYGHHECFHRCELVTIDRGYVMCPECGQTWNVDTKPMVPRQANP